MDNMLSRSAARDCNFFPFVMSIESEQSSLIPIRRGRETVTIIKIY